ncbi:MAG: trypsin-like peptidase domain-containing protein [Defluviitaleaceae bacterium]|nr:trypsin-like peptidase domain-containing protein [Defluviitaleaceae bacterium]
MKSRKFLAVACAAALMFGGGYAGASLAMQNQPASYLGAPMVQQNHLTTVGYQTPQTRDLTLPELFEGANPAVVAISTQITGRNIFGQPISQPSSGSGFLVSPDGYIVTNSHVIENASTINVLMYDGNVRPAALVGTHPTSDLAVIKIEVENAAYLTLGDSDIMRVGDQVAAIGNPLGELANSMTVGHISALNRHITIDDIAIDMLQTDAAVNRGNSGGPLLNLQGKVVGIVTAKSIGVDVEGLGFAIPSSYAKEIVENLIDYGFVRGRAVMGVQIGQAGGQLQIASVNRGGAAYLAGLVAGDIILSANLAPITTFESLREILDNLSAGDALELQIRRGAEEMTLTVILDEYRPVGI